MEVAGLAIGAVGLVGLYSACLEAVTRVSSYRHAQKEKLLFAQLDANKDILQKWASRVENSVDGLLEPHDSRLDDLSTAQAVCSVLSCI